MLDDGPEQDLRDQRRNGIPDLLLNSISMKDMMMREGLEGSQFSISKSSLSIRVCSLASIASDGWYNTRGVPGWSKSSTAIRSFNVVVGATARDFVEDIPDAC